MKNSAKRIQFMAPLEMVKEMDDMKKKLGGFTLAELLRAEHKILKWLIEEKAAGRIITSTNKLGGDKKELIILYL